jgi:hypothetical protein
VSGEERVKVRIGGEVLQVENPVYLVHGHGDGDDCGGMGVVGWSGVGGRCDAV